MGGGFYAPLMTLSNYSFLEGASFPEELVMQAAALDLPAVALTDRDGMYGMVRAHVAAREAGVKLLVGTTVTRSDGPPVVLLACTKRGYGSICTLISQGRAAADKGKSAATTPQLVQACPRDVLLIHPGLHEETRMEALLSAFKGRMYAGVARYLLPGDEARIARVKELASRFRLPLVLAPTVCFHARSRKALSDVLTAVRHVETVEESAGRVVPNGNFSLLPRSVMGRLYHDCPAASAATMEVADRCTFSLDEIRYRYPNEVVPAGQTPMGYLRGLAAERSRARYPRGLPPDVDELLARELALIEELDYPNYFLTMFDIVEFARGRGILCQGRGSAANSAVCFVLGITAVDPAHSNLLFERFISRERNEPPDIDVDFEHERREEVIQYIYERYGRHRAAMVAEFIRYRTRSAIRDVGKALGLTQPQVERLANLASSLKRDREDWWNAAVSAAGFAPGHPKFRAMGTLIRELKGFPRHLSIHVGGFVISDVPVHELVPIEPARMEGRTVIQWDKEDVEDARLLKIDVLGLGMLSCLRRSFDMLRGNKGVTLDLATIPPDDRPTFEMAQRADTVGVFQIESRAQMNMLPRLRPANYYDLVVEVALVRPGPIQGKMVHPYLRRRQGKEPVTFPIPELEPVLGRTYGVPLFQEQVMKLAMVAAGFTAGEADQLRRAMGTWRTSGRLDGILDKLIKRMEERGIAPGFAMQIADQVKGFGEYGFPESHAASFALLAYASAYLKCHHPDVFAAALLNSQPMGFYSVSTLLEDAKRHGVAVLPVCVNRSEWDSTLETGIRLGFSQVRGFPKELAERVVAVRQEQGPFSSFDAFVQAVRLPVHALLKLALAGALGGLGLERREALWAVLMTRHEPDSLFYGSREEGRRWAPLSAAEVVLADVAATRTFVSMHPFELVYPRFAGQPRFVTSAKLAGVASGRRVVVGGLAVVRQRPPTARGLLFLTLEDHEGLMNLLVTPQVLAAHREVLLEEPFLLVDGTVERADGVSVVRAFRVKAIRLVEDRKTVRSRDFR